MPRLRAEMSWEVCLSHVFFSVLWLIKAIVKCKGVAAFGFAPLFCFWKTAAASQSSTNVSHNIIVSSPLTCTVAVEAAGGGVWFYWQKQLLGLAGTLWSVTCGAAQEEMGSGCLKPGYKSHKGQDCCICSTTGYGYFGSTWEGCVPPVMQPPTTHQMSASASPSQSPSLH